MHMHSRHSWGARAPRLSQMSPQGPPTEAFIHHGAEADAKRVDTLEEMQHAMRQIQNFHMDVRGWSDIAYHYVVFQPDDNHDYAMVFHARDPHYVPAAQLNHNTNTLAICVYGNNEDVPDKTVRTIAAILKQHHGLRTVGGHRDVTQTECPGPKLYAKIPLIAQLADLKRYGH